MGEYESKSKQKNYSHSNTVSAHNTRSKPLFPGMVNVIEQAGQHNWHFMPAQLPAQMPGRRVVR